MQAKYNGVMNCKNTIAETKNTLQCEYRQSRIKLSDNAEIQTEKKKR